jgi:hypothetical protein
MRLPPEEAIRFIGLYVGLIGWCARRRDPKSSIHDAGSFLAASMQAKLSARDRMLDEPRLLDEYVAENPNDLGPEDLAIVAAWRSFKRGDFIVERDLKRHTIFIERKSPPVAYGVLSLTDEIVDIFPIPLPVLVTAVLLPWNDSIVCDGLLRTTNVYLGPGYRRDLAEAYREAKARGIITAFPDEGPSPDAKVRSAKTKQPSKDRARPGVRRRADEPQRAFVGRWRIAEMERWDADYLEMDGTPFIEVESSGRGMLRFGLIEGELDCRFSSEDGRPLMEFSWDGADEGTPTCGRGRVRIEESGEMRGRIFIHLGDDSALVATKEGQRKRRR